MMRQLYLKELSLLRMKGMSLTNGQMLTAIRLEKKKLSSLKKFSLLMAQFSQRILKKL